MIKIRPYTRRLVIFGALILFFAVNPLIGADQNAVPERIILNITAKPTTQIAVTWRTGPGVKTSRVDYMLASPRCNWNTKTEPPQPYQDIKCVTATSKTVSINKNTNVLHHSAILKNLVPNTPYQYRVGDGETWSEWCHFRTSKIKKKPFKFIYMGDPQNDLKNFCSRAFRAAFTAAPDAGFFLVTGDLVANPWRDEEWGELFYAAGWMPRHIPFIMMPGNHSYHRKKVWTYTAKKPHHLWFDHFTLPRNGPPGLKETAYFFDYQGVRFIILNGNEKLEEQAVWMDSILAKNTNRWTIVSIHQPFYSTGKHRDNPGLRELFLPIIDKYSVDLVLQGHDHTYGRTYKLRNNRVVRDSERGTVFVVSVSGPKFYEINEKHNHLMKKTGADMQLFQVITVKGNVLVYEA
ncbi:MAG: metallophosphoesterase family protein, partial [bacterium]|nr:metallophosphoesterase family protein [bacterium]